MTTMAAGWMRGKRYTRLQVSSVAVLTLGVMVSAWADAQSKVKVTGRLCKYNHVDTDTSRVKSQTARALT